MRVRTNMKTLLKLALLTCLIFSFFIVQRADILLAQPLLFENASVSLLSPNGGETLNPGEAHLIQWNAPVTTASFKLKYSIDNGESWNLLVSDISGSSYEWTVPSLVSNKKKCLVKIVGYDDEKIKTGADKSDATFTITAPVQVITPNGNEEWTYGNSYLVTWDTFTTATTVSQVKLKYTTNGGQSWGLIETLDSNPGSYLWEAPPVWSKKRECKIKIVLVDSIGKVLGKDNSDDFFTMPPAGDVDNYVPFSIGTTWHYAGTATLANGASQNYKTTRTIKGTKLVDGVLTTVFKETNPLDSGVSEKAFLRKTTRNLIDYGNNDPDDNLTPQIAPYIIGKFPIVPGYGFVSLNKTGLDYGDDLDGDNINEQGDIYSEINVISNETVTVPSGVFTNSAKVKNDLAVSVRLSANNQTVKVTAVQKSFLAPDTGTVKTSTVFKYPDGSSEKYEELLTGRFNVFAENLAQGDSDTEAPGKPAVGFDGTNYLIATSMVTSQFDAKLYGVFVSPSGEILSTLDIATGDEGDSLYSTNPGIAFGQNNYLVVFIQDGQLAGQRITPAGQLLDGSTGFAITTTGTNSRAAVAFDGVNFLVTWAKFVDGNYDIYGAFITQEGQNLGEFIIYTGSGEQVSPTLGFDGSNYLAVWRDTPTGSGPANSTNISAARVTPSGTVLDPTGFSISNASGYQGAPHLTFDGSNYFAVWEDARTFADVVGQIPGVDIYGARISTDGTVLDTEGIPINTALYMYYNGKGNPTVATINDQYFVSWKTGSYPNNKPAGIYAAWVSSEGVVFDTTEDGVSISGPPESSAKYVYPVVNDGNDKSLLVWINNNELSGSSKSLLGTIIVAP